MYSLATFIFGMIFMLILVFSSCIFKAIFKIQSFIGFFHGLCCAFTTAIVILIYVIIVGLLFAFVIKNNSSGNTGEESLGSFTIGSLLFICACCFILFVIIFVLIYIFTKKVSVKEIPYNTIFMFGSGYILFKAIFSYLIYMAIINYPSNHTEKDGIFESFFYTLIEIVWFFWLLSLIGTSIMCMLHHRKVNSFIIWINIGCFFGPLIFIMLFFLTLKTFFLSYMNFIPTLATIGLSTCFYFKYQGESPSGQLLNSQEGVEMSQ